MCQEPTHKIPPMTRSWGENLTGMADQVFRDSKKLPPVLTLKMISVFLMLASINFLGGGILWDYPGWKECFNLNSFAGILVWLANASMPLVQICMTAYNTLIIKHHKEPEHIKALIDIEPFGEWGSPIRKHKKNYSKSGYWVNICLLCFCS